MKLGYYAGKNYVAKILELEKGGNATITIVSRQTKKEVATFSGRSMNELTPMVNNYMRILEG